MRKGKLILKPDLLSKAYWKVLKRLKHCFLRFLLTELCERLSSLRSGGSLKLWDSDLF